MKKITIFHVFSDDKFFDRFQKFYSSLKNVENRFFFYTRNKNYKFNYIKNTEQIRVINSWILYIKELLRKDVDIVFFHGMRGKRYFYANIIRKNVKLVWWEWGFDIYLGWKGLPPLVDIELYKPITKKFFEGQNPVKKQNQLLKLANYPINSFLKAIQKKALSRVDYFMPTLEVEYELLKKNHPDFKAKKSFVGFNPYNPIFVSHTIPGNIQIGNSLTYTNNHLDIFDYLYKIDFSDRKIFIPVSYGTGYGGVDELIKQCRFPNENVIWMKDFMKREDYILHCRTITHAIFGMMRQQGMGNINNFMRDGTKVYLFKDSVIAQQLRKDGYIFFTIEDDLNQESLSTCLCEEDARHNLDIYMKHLEGHLKEDVAVELEKMIFGN